jgi:hypothetical protein
VFDVGLFDQCASLLWLMFESDDPHR